jgi:hypothetical protein
VDIDFLMDNNIAASPTDADEGKYIVVTTGGVLSSNTAPTEHSVLPPGDEGDYTFPVTLEAGDIIILNNVSGTLPYYEWGILQQTFTDATTETKGIVKLHDDYTTDGGSTTAATGGALYDLYSAWNSYTHTTFDYDVAALINDYVFSNLTIEDGVITAVSTRQISPSDIGAATTTHNHDSVYLKLNADNAVEADITLKADGTGTVSSHGLLFEFEVVGTPDTRTLLVNNEAKLMYNGFQVWTASEITATDQTNWDSAYSHISATNNPHAVTAAQVGAAESSHTHTNYVTSGADDDITADHTYKATAETGTVYSHHVRFEYRVNDTPGYVTLSAHNDGNLYANATAIALANHTHTYTDVGADKWGAGMQYYATLTAADGASGHSTGDVVLVLNDAA